MGDRIGALSLAGCGEAEMLTAATLRMKTRWPMTPRDAKSSSASRTS